MEKQLEPASRSHQILWWCVLAISVILIVLRLSVSSSPERVLQQGQLTDGRIVLSVPDGYKAEVLTEEGYSYFEVSSDSLAESIAVYSDYVSRLPEGGIEALAKVLQIPELEELKSSSSSRREVVEGVPCIHYTRLYTSDDGSPAIDWHLLQYTLAPDSAVSVIISSYDFLGTAAFGRLIGSISPL